MSETGAITYRSRVMPRRSRRWPTTWVGIVVLVPLIILPIVFVLYGALRSAPPGQEGTLTFDNFSVLADGEFLSLVTNTLILIVGVTVISVVAAAVLAVATTRLNIPWRGLTDALIVVPAYVPNLVGAIAWSFLLSPKTGYLNSALNAIGIPSIDIYSWGGVIGVSALYAIPIAYLYMKPALLSIDQTLEEASGVLGANRMTTLRTIVLPLIRPAIKSAGLVIVVSSLSNFAVIAVLGTPAGIDVLALRIVQYTSLGPIDLGKAAVLGLVLAGSAAVGLAATFRGMRSNDYATVGGKFVSRKIDVPMGFRILGTAVCWAYILCTVILPTAVLVVGSLQPYISPDFSAGWTLRNYELMASYPGAMTAVGNSVLFSILASLCAAALSLVLGYSIVRVGGRLGAIVNQISSFPLAVPHMVFAIGMIWLWVGVPLGPYGTKWMLLLAYIALYLPYAIRSSTTAFRQIDPSLEEAGQVHGSSPLGVLFRISTPLVLPGLLAGATIVLYHSMQEIAASLILYSPGQPVMTVAIWNMSQTGAYPQLFSLSVVYIVLTLVMVGGLNLLTRRLGGAALR